MADLARRRLGLPIPMSEGLAVAACSRLDYSCAKAERELGYTHRPARQAVHDAVSWYRERGLIRDGADA
jgi:nucleoside-diphosphate-sugar epimerase